MTDRSSRRAATAIRQHFTSLQAESLPIISTHQQFSQSRQRTSSKGRLKSQSQYQGSVDISTEQPSQNHSFERPLPLQKLQSSILKPAKLSLSQLHQKASQSILSHCSLPFSQESLGYLPCNGSLIEKKLKRSSNNNLPPPPSLYLLRMPLQPPRSLSANDQLISQTLPTILPTSSYLPQPLFSALTTHHQKELNEPIIDHHQSALNSFSQKSSPRVANLVQVLTTSQNNQPPKPTQPSTSLLQQEVQLLSSSTIIASTSTLLSRGFVASSRPRENNLSIKEESGRSSSSSCTKKKSEDIIQLYSECLGDIECKYKAYSSGHENFEAQLKLLVLRNYVSKSTIECYLKRRRFTAQTQRYGQHNRQVEYYSLSKKQHSQSSINRKDTSYQQALHSTLQIDFQTLPPSLPSEILSSERKDRQVLGVMKSKSSFLKREQPSCYPTIPSPHPRVTLIRQESIKTTAYNFLPRKEKSTSYFGSAASRFIMTEAVQSEVKQEKESSSSVAEEEQNQARNEGAVYGTERRRQMRSLSENQKFRQGMRVNEVNMSEQLEEKPTVKDEYQENIAQIQWVNRLFKRGVKKMHLNDQSYRMLIKSTNLIIPCSPRCIPIFADREEISLPQTLQKNVLLREDNIFLPKQSVQREDTRLPQTRTILAPIDKNKEILNSLTKIPQDYQENCSFAPQLGQPHIQRRLLKAKYSRKPLLMQQEGPLKTRL